MLSTSLHVFPDSQNLSFPNHQQTPPVGPSSLLIPDHHRSHPHKSQCVEKEHLVNPTLTLMSNFSSSETLDSQLNSTHLPQYRDSYVELSTRNVYRLLQQHQFCMPPFDNKPAVMSAIMNPSDISLLLEDKSPIRAERSGCSRDSNVFQIDQQTWKEISGDVIPPHNIGNDKSISTFYTDAPSSCEKHIIAEEPSFNEPGHISLSCENHSNLQNAKVRLVHQNVIPKEQDKHVIDFTTMNKLAATGNDSNNPQHRRNPSTRAIHQLAITPATFKQGNTSIDKKEMRARRNRESARRSRMKSKQHFLALERTFVLMDKENKALRTLVENLLAICIEKFPHTRGILQSLFGESL